MRYKKPESDFRILDPSWVKRGRGKRYLLAAIFAFLAGFCSAGAILSAQASLWPQSVLIAALATILWRRVWDNARYAAQRFSELEKLSNQ